MRFAKFKTYVWHTENVVHARGASSFMSTSQEQIPGGQFATRVTQTQAISRNFFTTASQVTTPTTTATITTQRHPGATVTTFSQGSGPSVTHVNQVLNDQQFAGLWGQFDELDRQSNATTVNQPPDPFAHINRVLNEPEFDDLWEQLDKLNKQDK